MSRVASASPSVPRRHGAPVAHALAHPNSAQAASSAGACRYGAAGSWGVTGPGRMSWLPRCSVVGFGPELLLGGRGGAGTILTMAATVVAGILALRLAAATSRMASRGTRCRGSAAEPQFFSWQIQRRTDLGSIPPVPPPTNPAPQNPGVLLRANSCMMECSALLRIKTMRAMFRAADERLPPTAARP